MALNLNFMKFSISFRCLSLRKHFLNLESRGSIQVIVGARNSTIIQLIQKLTKLHDKLSGILENANFCYSFQVIHHFSTKNKIKISLISSAVYL